MRAKSTLGERILQVSMSSVPSEKLEMGINAFRQQMTANDLFKELDYSASQTWTYSLAQGRDGGPEIVNRAVHPEHVFWDKAPDGAHAPSWRLKVSSNEIIFNYLKSDADDGGTWAGFIGTALMLLTVLKRVLDIRAWQKMVVTYYFTYSSQTVSDREMVKPDWIEVRDLLQPFKSMPRSDGFVRFSPSYLWEQSWFCERGGGQYLVHSRLDTNHAAQQAGRPPKGNTPLEIHLFLGVELPSVLLKNENVIPGEEVFSLLKDNYRSMLTEKSFPVLSGDCR